MRCLCPAVRCGATARQQSSERGCPGRRRQEAQNCLSHRCRRQDRHHVAAVNHLKPGVWNERCHFGHSCGRPGGVVLAGQHQALSSMRFRILLRHVAAQGSNSSRRRVCLHLLDLVGSYGAPHEHGTAISISFTQQEMGSICGLSRVSVSQIFTQLERQQVITRAGRLVVVVDAAQLELLSRT